MKLFGWDIQIGRNETINEDVTHENIHEDIDFTEMVNQSTSVIDESDSGLYYGEITQINEDVSKHSLKDIRSVLDSDNLKMSTLIDALKQDFSLQEAFIENEEMAKDTIIGSAMELMADDCSVVNATTKKVVHISSKDKNLEKFLNDFLEHNIKIEDKYWEWTFEAIKHGDFKLRRREYSGKQGRGVHYESVTEGYKIHRIEYMGQVLGYLDDEEGVGSRLVKPDAFVHFMSGKLPKRKKIKVKIRGSEDSVQEEDIVCYKVHGSCLLDNARYIYRVVNLLDDMLIMSRVARSTQFNLVKIEVGNAGPRATQSLIADVRRRIEGSTKMNKNQGMRTDPSPIPVNSNVYLPVREGKGDITIESINDNVDVKSITDIDYFRNKEFASIRTPKAFLGFDEMIGSGMGNTNLTKLDIRYSRTVSRAQNIVVRGIRDLCNNYLEFRGRGKDVNAFEVVVRSVTSTEDSSLIEDIMMRSGIIDTFSNWFDYYPEMLDKQKSLHYLLSLIGINPTDVGTDAFIKHMNNLKKGTEEKKDTKKNLDTGNSDDEGFDREHDSRYDDPNVDSLKELNKKGSRGGVNG